MLDPTTSLSDAPADAPRVRLVSAPAQRGDTVDGAMTTVRIQENVLARHERRLLNWLCARMPAWVTPDVLTALGVLGRISNDKIRESFVLFFPTILG